MVNNLDQGKPRVLILAGTTQARELAACLALDPRLEIISSLAGRTQAPEMPTGLIRSGGFGGITGLQTYLAQETIQAVIDATHPFAAQISHQAILATQSLNIPYLMLTRPAWTPTPEDHWLSVPDHQTAAQILPGLGSRIFLTIGRQDLHQYANVPGWFLMRMIDPPTEKIPTGELLYQRGPFALADELALLQAWGIQVVVSKNSGGAATYTKIQAARMQQLPVVMIQRPRLPACTQVFRVAAAQAWLGEQLSLAPL